MKSRIYRTRISKCLLDGATLEIVLLVVRLAEVVDHHTALYRCVHKIAVAQVDGNVRNSVATNLKEQQITFLQFVFRHRVNLTVQTA